MNANENGLSMRPETPRDLKLIYQIFADSRPDIRAAVHLAEEVRAELMQMQFNAQTDHYKKHFPAADFGVIEFKGQPVGRCYLNRDDHEILIIDLAILTAHRGQGFGVSILRAIQEEARLSDRKVRLHVEKQNPAFEMYKNHGFEIISEKEMHWEMEWSR